MKFRDYYEVLKVDRNASEKRINTAFRKLARKFIARSGYDPVYGARPLCRYIQRELETKIGRALVAGDILEGATIRVALLDGAPTVTHTNPV